MIKTITIFNSSKQFDDEVNELLVTGWSISSTACSSYGAEETYHECYQAILFNDNE